MSKLLGQSWFDRRVRTRAIEQWRSLGKNISGRSLSDLLKLRSDAYRAIDVIEAFTQTATVEIGGHLSRDVEIRKSKNADWAWRPEVFFQKGCVAPQINPASGVGVGSNISLHHNASACSMILKQVTTLKSTSLAPFDIALEVFDFDGSFLSLSLDLPETAMHSLSNQNIFEMEFRLTSEQQLPIFARINVKHGPNVEEQIKELSHQHENFTVEFDLGYMDLNEHRLEKVWIDLIFDDAQMNRIVLHDLTVCRRLRAQF